VIASRLANSYYLIATQETKMANKHHIFTNVWQSRAVRSIRHLASADRWYRWSTASQRRLPDFIVAGAQKCGTTSLWAYLSEHPNVTPPMTKEMSFFDVNFQRGLNWYRMHFPLNQTTSSAAPASVSLTGESTAYYMFHPLAAQRIAEMSQNIKIILLLRNPIDRAFSHYQLKVRRRQEQLSFEDALAAEPQRLAGEQEKILADPHYYSVNHDRFSYLSRGIYADQLIRWRRIFTPDRLLILESSEFFNRTAEVFERVLQFLGLPNWKPEHFGNRFPGKYRERMSDDTRLRLIEYFRPHNERLFELLGQRFNWDKISPAKQAA
jgi:hypothetical protein